MTWKKISETAPNPPQRPAKGGHGTKGAEIVLTTNHFPVEIKDKNLKLYHYDVTIKDFKGDAMVPELPKSKNMKIFEKLKKSFPRVFDAPMSYDSVKNAYSTKLIKQLVNEATYEVRLEDEERKKAAKEDQKKANRSTYKVTIRKVSEASLKELFDSMKYVQGNKKELPTTIIQMIEVMFRHYRALKYEQISGRNFFSVEGEFAQHRPIGGGKIGVTGFFGSLRPAAWKDGSVLLNLDMAHTAFYEEMPVMDFMKEVDFGIDFNRVIGERFLKPMTKALKGLKVRVNYANRRTYKVYEVHTLGADRTRFSFTDKNNKTSMMTVRDYFKTQYNLVLKFPFFNCLNVGNQNKEVYIPVELCKIDKGQKVKKKLSEKEVAQFIRSTAVPPHDRLKQIKSVAAKNNFKDDEMLKAMTFTIADMPLETKGRVLPAPGLTMDRNRFLPNYGVWDIRSKTFHKPGTLENWAVINYDGYKTQVGTIQRFVDRLVQMGRQKGMKIENPSDIYDGGRDPNPHADLVYYQNNIKDLQMVMCVLPGRKHYGAIKKAGDTQLNIITQCVQGQNVAKCQDQTIGNILLKINAKMDGINNIVTKEPPVGGLMVFKEPFMVMGADVNHPPAGGDRAIPSIAAVVGSYDPTATMYAVERRAQFSRVEVITNMKEFTINLLKNFYKQTNKLKPQRIIMYRDGVSESQFTEVLKVEMLGIRNACLEIQKDGSYKPGITFICVQKRHHTRLFCDEKYVGNQRNKNVPPGTIVDRDITHPTETDFFLCSHQGIQGTSKPTHYHLLWDDNDFPIDDLQAMTYKLCHVYSRCARSVSIPTPVYYAHLAAFRAKVYVTEMLANNSESGSTVSGDEQISVTLQREICETARAEATDPYSKRLHYI